MTKQLQRLLKDFQKGRLSERALIEQLKELPFKNFPFAKIDLHRALRRGFPEVIYAKGKSSPQVISIAQALWEKGSPVLVTRAAPSLAKAAQRRLPWLRYYPKAKILASFSGNGKAPGIFALRRTKRRTAPIVLVITAGTSDIPVAEEAAVTCEWMGAKVLRLFDVGVAGLHRLLGNVRLLWKAKSIVVVAGMDGALPSVVSGLVDCPVVAVPTSYGYGASFEGVGPLLTMLNSCSPGVAVVNIDNGFGAGYLAALICRHR